MHQYRKDRQDNRGLPIDKIAGLESHQFARETNRFNAVFSPPNHHNLPRRPRVGQNSRNESDTVFQFSAQPLSGVPGKKFQPTTDPDRFPRLSADQEEKERIGRKKEKFLKRVDVKRDWKHEIEMNRWNHENKVYEKEQEMVQQRKQNTKNGMNSVSYNLISLDYQNNERGQELRKKDAEAKYRLSIRTAKLYTQRNTFNPTRCIDIPRFSNLDPSFTVKDKAAGVKTVNSDPSTSIYSSSKRDDEEGSTGGKTVADYIKAQIDVHGKEIKEITGEEPVLRDGLLQWRLHF